MRIVKQVQNFTVDNLDKKVPVLVMELSALAIEIPERASEL